MYFVNVKKTKNMGLGVFATKDFKTGEIIEKCPVIPIPIKLVLVKKHRQVLDFLEWWFYEWGNDLKGDAMVLGYGMIYNHSENPNAIYKSDFVNNVITIISKKSIKLDEELFIDYRLPGDTDKVSFKAFPSELMKIYNN